MAAAKFALAAVKLTAAISSPIVQAILYTSFTIAYQASMCKDVSATAIAIFTDVKIP